MTITSNFPTTRTEGSSSGTGASPARSVVAFAGLDLIRMPIAVGQDA